MEKPIDEPEKFMAELHIEYFKPSVYKEEYGKTVLKEVGVQRVIVTVKLTASTLEKLQEKLVAHVGLAEL